MAEKIIELKEATKYYEMGENLVKALNGMDISISQGEFIAIMGPSGSGKSTSMNLVGSLDLPTSGKIYLDGKDISFLEESELAQIRGRKIGFIFQNFNLIPNFTAKENIMLPMMFQELDEEERERKTRELLNLVDLSDREDHYPTQLSGGEQQRVAIARALANDPEVILADEPTGNLDTKTGESIMHFLEDLNKRGKTIILVTHDSSLAQKYTKKIFSLVDGKIQKIIQKGKSSKWEELS